MNRKILLFSFAIFLVFFILVRQYYIAYQKKMENMFVYQENIANYLYNNYVLYLEDQPEINRLLIEYANGKDGLSLEQYKEKLKHVKKDYIDITHIKFLKVSESLHGVLEYEVLINDVYKTSVRLGSLKEGDGANHSNFELYKLEFKKNNYLLEKKKIATKQSLDTGDVTYYRGPID